MKTAITDAALSLCARMGWEHVSLNDLAREAGLSLADLRGVIACKSDVLLLLHEQLDAAMLQSTSFEGTAKDRLFDLFMARFDAMNRHRAAYLSLLGAMPYQPHNVLRAAPLLISSANWAMQAASIDHTGFKQTALKLALTVVLLSALRAWRTDESADLSAVMAALDQGLDRALR